MFIVCHRVVDSVVRAISGHDQAIARWVGERIGIEAFGQCVAIGIVDEWGNILAGVVYNNYREGVGLEATIASTSPRWCNRAMLAAIFGYPFDQVGCRRLTAITERKNQPVRAFLCRIGFREEGLLRHGFPSDDAVVYGMLREECRWLRTKEAPRACAA